MDARYLRPSARVSGVKRPVSGSGRIVGRRRGVSGIRSTCNLRAGARVRVGQVERSLVDLAATQPPFSCHLANVSDVNPPRVWVCFDVVSPGRDDRYGRIAELVRLLNCPVQRPAGVSILNSHGRVPFLRRLSAAGRLSSSGAGRLSGARNLQCFVDALLTTRQRCAVALLCRRFRERLAFTSLGVSSCSERSLSKK